MNKAFGFNFKYTYTELPSLFYQRTMVDSIDNPQYVLFNDGLAERLGLDKENLNTASGARFLTGQDNQVKGSTIAMAYAGHQYGHFTVLGDGRACLLGEHVHNNERYDIHLKGSGATKYSRGFDGKATLRSAMLEYLFSEAMHALGVETSRSLAVIKTNEKIKRIGEEDGAILVRLAKSHLRVGTFEYAAYREDYTALKKLVEYAIARHDKDLVNDEYKVAKWYANVVKRQAELVAKWQSIGFVHGVMNTDNTTISGETIDYGPCAFIDHYDLKSVYSSIDDYGRYAFGQQPYIMSWNMAKLGEVILPLIDDNKRLAIEKVQSILGTFGDYFEEKYYALMGYKLGLSNLKDYDKPLINELLSYLEDEKVDYTHFFYALSRGVELDVLKSDKLKKWHQTWLERIKDEQNPPEMMKKHNPLMIPRNYLVKKALDDAVYSNDFSLFNDLLSAVKHPFDEKKVPKRFIEPPKDFYTHITYCGT